MANGISRNTYRAVFAGVSEPDHDVIEKARFQPEFQDKIWDYLDNRVNDESVAEGRRMLVQYKPWLDRIEKRFGVDRHILLAIWSMESNYGRILERDDVMKSVPQALATLAYMDPKRAKFARTQLLAALKIVQDGHVTPKGLTGSWAGAMGHTQFIPTSYQAYAVDMDGNGHPDIWNSIPDALATAANLLAKNGWQTGKSWGYEVVAPAGSADMRGSNRKLSQWAASGFQRVSGRAFPSPGDNANLLMPAGASGPAFLMTKNFFVIKRYNNADKYALAVGHLADRIAGTATSRRRGPVATRPLDGGALRGAAAADEPRPLRRQDRRQDRLGSKASITAYQRRAGVAEDGNASKALLDLLRKH